MIAFSLTNCAQSDLVKRLELKRLTLENTYRTVGPFDTLTGIATVYDNGRMGYIDSTGRLIVSIDYITRDFSDGLGIVHNYEQKIFRVIDKSANTKRVFDNISSLFGFKNGQSIFAGKSNDGRYGVMDIDGNTVIRNVYPFINRISNKYYFVSNNKEGAGIIDAVGDTLIPLKYIISYIDTLDLHFIGYQKDVGYGIFDSKGNVQKFWGKRIFVENSYIEGTHYFQRDSLIIIKNQFSSTDAKYALLNLKLDTIVPMGKYNLQGVNEEMVRYFQSIRVSNGTAQLSKFGFLNTKGEIIIPAQFDYAQYFTEGLSAVKKNEKWGYIDKQGKLVIAYLFDYALPFRNGYAKVKVGESFYIIDKSGKRVLNSKSY
jgi:hypothetical protein